MKALILCVPLLAATNSCEPKPEPLKSAPTAETTTTGGGKFVSVYHDGHLWVTYTDGWHRSHGGAMGCGLEHHPDCPKCKPPSVQSEVESSDFEALAQPKGDTRDE